jgi:hypothetical protein
MSRAGYRQLLRSARTAFSQDALALRESKKELKKHFFANEYVSDPNQLKELLMGIKDVDEMLRFNIVQATRNQEKGNFEVKLNPEHQVTVDAGQVLPHGPELSPIDPSFIGKHVGVTKHKADKKPLGEGDVPYPSA